MSSGNIDKLADRVQKSTEERLQRGSYIDDLQKKGPYEIERGGEKNIDEEKIKRAKNAHAGEDPKEVVKAFLQLPKFAYEEPFLGLIKHSDCEAIENNPETVKDIAEEIWDMDIEDALARPLSSAVANRQFGGSFISWAKEKVGRAVSYNVFQETTPDRGEAIIMNESGKEMKRFLKERGYNLDKEPDMLVKKTDKTGETFLIVCEAKFNTDFGGHQTENTNDAKEVAETIHCSDNEDIGIMVIDGVSVIEPRDSMNRKPQYVPRESDAPFMSSLDLPLFVNATRVGEN